MMPKLSQKMAMVTILIVVAFIYLYSMHNEGVIVPRKLCQVIQKILKVLEKCKEKSDKK